MKHLYKAALIFPTAILAFLIGCSCNHSTTASVDAQPEATPTAVQETAVPVAVTSTPAPTVTPEPTQEPTPEPTATPEPTPVPTATPEPTATPVPPVVMDQEFLIVSPERQSGIQVSRTDSKNTSTHQLELRLEDGTVVGSCSLSKPKDKLLFTLPQGCAARTTVFLWESGTDYPIGTRDICVTDPTYEPVKGNYERDDKMIALTFDCAYGESNTDYLLDTLEQYGIHVTFFTIGTWVGNHYSPWMERMLKNGHELGNHTENHKKLTEASVKNVYRQIDGTTARLQEKLDYQAHLFRPPYGSRNAKTDAIARYLGYEVITWAIDSADSRTKIDAKTIKHRVLDNVKPGDIILFHNGAPDLKEYLVPILDELTARGYTFGTVSELMNWQWDNSK